ncbi:MAG: DUF4405 domain-containing protein [Desulfobacteraceae bacterium]|jgi:hypothetical protein
MNSLLKRTWISPFVALSFLIVSLTGLLMFMHVRNHVLNSLHEWMGILFVITGIFHLIVNWSVFLSYFRKKEGAIAIVVVLLFSIIFTFSGLLNPHDRSFHSDRKSSYSYHRH